MKHTADPDNVVVEKRRSTRFASTWLSIALVLILLVAAVVIWRMYGGSPM